MARRKVVRSLTVPITLASVAVTLSAALLVGWTLLLAKNIERAEEVAGDVWLLVLGIVSFAFIIAVLVVFSLFLAREILEVRRQDSFIDSVTHELKSPLASLKLSLETQGRDDIDAATRENLRQMGLEDVDRLWSFIDDVLQASRLAHERTGLDLSDVSLRDLVERCATLAADRHKIERGAIRVDVAEDLRVSTDRVALEVVVRNLIDNAIKYSPTPPDVAVSARVADGRPVIEVADRGIGIPRKHLKRVFHRFFRVPSEAVRERRGTGLGLFVVYALVRNLGGRVRALSEGPGRGTTMRVELPRQSLGVA